MLHMTAMPVSSLRGLLTKSVLLSVSAILLMMEPAHAMLASVPGAVSAGQVGKQFEEAPSIPSSPDLQFLIPGDSEIPQAVQDELAKKTFVLSAVELDGATAYPEGTFAKFYQEKVGQTISLLDARMIAKSITTRYHNDGYILSQAVVPAQDVTSGKLKIQIVEGKVGNVTVDGKDLSASQRAALDGYAKKITAEHPVSLKTLEKYMLLINDLPGVTASGLLRPMENEFGAAELVLTINDQRFNGSYSFDNRGSKFIGPWQHTLALSVNSLYGLYDTTQARFFFAFPDTNELVGGELSHELPLGHNGTKLSLLGSVIDTKPGDSLKVLDINGESTFLQAKVTHPFIRSRQENLIGRFAIDYRDTMTDIFKDTRLTKDQLRSVRVGGTYGFTDALRGNVILDTQASQGMNILSATDDGFMRSNTKGDASYTKFNLDASRIQPLPYKLSLLVGASGQYALTPLLVDEQFGVGGSEYARAFHSSDSLGDHGVAGKTELRYTDGIGLPYLDSYQLYSFYDIGRTWLSEAESGENNKTLRSSTGAGVRLNFNRNFSANFEAAVPLIGPAVNAGDSKHETQFYMNAVARF